MTATSAAPAPAPEHELQLQQQAPPPPSVLVVFDYDWSLVNDDSDLFIFRELHPELLLELQERYLHMQWTQLMDELLLRLATERPALSKKEIEATLARIPIQPKMLDAVRLAVLEHGATVHIVSDANTFYIQSMLENEGIASLVSEVHSNPAHFEAHTVGDGDEDGGVVKSSRLRVERYHGLHLEPHGCLHCQVNMCKGMIIDRTLSQQKFDHVLYVGDGRGDYCPATKLSSGDMVFARDGSEPNGKVFELLGKINENRHEVRASVVPWATGEDIYNQFRQFFSQLSRK